MVNIVGEIGINHNGDMSIVESLIDLAAYAGFNYVKFQKRTPDICVPEKQKDEMRDTPWGKMKYIEYRKKVEFGMEEYTHIDEYCKKKNIKWFASAWDKEAAAFLTYFAGNIIKVPSAKVTDEQLLKYCRDHFPYFILSTGMSNETEVQRAIEIGFPDVLMHSISIYPTPHYDSYMGYLKWLAMIGHECEVGYSGHEEGIDLAVLSVALGVTWVEKHITLDKGLWGGDQKMSIDPPEMFHLVTAIRRTEEAISKGNSPREVLEGELKKREQLRG